MKSELSEISVRALDTRHYVQRFSTRPAELPRGRACRRGPRRSLRRATSPGQRAHPAGGAPCHRSPLGCDSDTMACPATEGRPAAFDPVAGGPTRTQVRLKRLRESDRGGGCSERPPPKPKRASVRPTGPPATVPHAVHVKASSLGAGVVPGGGERTRRYAIKAWS